jgi:hypothetical protein
MIAEAISTIERRGLTQEHMGQRYAALMRELMCEIVSKPQSEFSADSVFESAAEGKPVDEIEIIFSDR